MTAWCEIVTAGPGTHPRQGQYFRGPGEAGRGGGNFPLPPVGWVAGCIMIWAARFTVGNCLYGRLDYGFGLLAVFVVSVAVLIGVIRRLWR